jgi:hypothetical protein
MSDNYRQPPNFGGSRPVALACPNGVPPEILSTWRDGLLPPDQATWIARHAPTCPACSERLRDYDAAASALAGQVIPRPGADLWPGVRAAIERETRGAAGERARRGLRLPRGMALGGIGAGVVALLLVALFAGLLIVRKPGRPTLASTPTTTQTATVAPTATITPTTAPSGPGYWTTLAGCSNVPADVRVQYGAGVQQQKGGAPTIVTLQRSDDCGATWTNLTPPAITGVSYTTNVNLMTIFASPVNSNTAYLTLQVNSSQVCSTTTTTAGARAAMSSMPCQMQFVTMDGGARWQRLQLPVPGLLGIFSNTTPQAESILRAQGSRLYGLVTDTVIGANSATPPGRLVASADGGVTWQVADAALAAQGLAVWDFAPTPSGSAIYVAAEPVNDPTQPPQYGVTLSMWSSLDAGATWTKESGPPGQSASEPVQGMTAGITPGGKRALYVLLFGANKDDTAIQVTVQASLDDGASWMSASQLTVSKALGSMQVMPGLTTATLPDGSVIILNLTPTGPVQAWFPGSAPRDIAQNPGLIPYYNPVVEQRADGVYLWMTGYRGGPNPIVEYTQLKL